MNELKTIIVTEKTDLIGYKTEILKLFSECFPSELEALVWEWAYIDNPFGAPIVALSYDGDRLVGHYAVIPYHLSNKQGELIKSCLSMTTMVAHSHRRYRLFTMLAELVYAEMGRQGYELVYGFPNEQSTPGFRKRLKWRIGESDFVARVTKKQLLGSLDLKQFIASEQRFGFPCEDQIALNWRMSKPLAVYEQQGSNLLKEFDGSIDLMEIDTIEGLGCLDGSKQYHVLLDSTVKDLLIQKVFGYQFGFRPIITDEISPCFRKSLIMSDVF